MCLKTCGQHEGWIPFKNAQKHEISMRGDNGNMGKDNKEILMNGYDRQIMNQIKRLEHSVGKASECYM